MAMANDMTLLINKIERRLGLMPLTRHLPREYNKEAWADLIQTDTLVTFSRYYPNRVKFTVNDDSCIKKKENNKSVYYIKDEYLGGAKLLGAIDIDWTDTSADNISVGQTAGYGYYIPNYGNMDNTLQSFVNMQAAADVGSLYNNNIFLEWEYPNKLIISRAGNVDITLKSFVVNLLVQHESLATISPTMMESFEALAQADVARFLFMNLRYFDGLETIYVNIDLKMNELDQEAGKRQDIIEKLESSYVSASNSNIPYILTVSG